jgi:hypothetical protein
VHPGGEQACPVETTLKGGGALVGDVGSEPDELPERGTRAGVASGGAQVTRGGCVVLLGRDGVPLGPQVGQAPAGLAERGVQGRSGGDRGGLAGGRPLVVDLGQAGPAGVANQLERRGQGVGVSVGDDVGGGRPAGGPGGQAGGGALAGVGQAGGGRVGIALLALEDRHLAG